MVIFYTWKYCIEIHLTKNKMNLNKSKMKNIKAQLELEPNFPATARVNDDQEAEKEDKQRKYNIKRSKMK